MLLYSRLMIKDPFQASVKIGIQFVWSGVSFSSGQRQQNCNQQKEQENAVFGDEIQIKSTTVKKMCRQLGMFTK